MKKFAMIGVGGYVAPRHLKAMASLGQRLVLACDVSDSVGILDSYFPNVCFTTKPPEFFRQVAALRGGPDEIDWVVIATPNHLHVPHACEALRAGANVLCEKPLALDEDALRTLSRMQQQTGSRICTVLQLRQHPAILALRDEMRKRSGTGASRCLRGHLTYVTSRGPWYHASWKGDESRSGGILTNIGVHLFDALRWIFGPIQSQTVSENCGARASGEVHFDQVSLTWLLSVRGQDVPAHLWEQGQRTVRELLLEGQAIEFTDGFTELHTEVYRQLLADQGWGIEAARPALEWIDSIRRISRALSAE